MSASTSSSSSSPSPSIPFSGNTLDRLHVHRKEEAFLAALVQRADTLFLPFFNLQPLFASSLSPEAFALSASDRPRPRTEISWLTRAQLHARGVALEDAEVILLGTHPVSGVAHCAVAVATARPLESAREEPSPEDPTVFRFHDMRRTMPLLAESQGSVLAHARSLIEWHANCKFCSRCGSPTVSIEGGEKRRCTNNSPPSSGSLAASSAPKISPETKISTAQSGQSESASSSTASSSSGARTRGCGISFYPRIDPVAIMCVVHPDGDRVLLGRKRAYPKEIYSCLAGFVSAGESVEDAVRRETKEESGVDVGSVGYVASQPWPFGVQLMIGCLAYATSETIVLADRELEDARWFNLEEITEMLKASAAPTSFFSGNGLRTAPPLAIAHQLVAHWAALRRSQTHSASSL